jgi:hypothetical protein
VRKRKLIAVFEWNHSAFEYKSEMMAW